MYHHKSQRDCRTGIELETTGSGAEKLVVGANVCVRLYKDGATWRRYDFSDPDSPSHAPIGDSVYIPSFRVVGMKVETSDDSAPYVKYDLGNEGMKVAYDKYAANVIHPLFITKVWLDSATTATAVTLYG